MKPLNDLEKQVRSWRAEPSAELDQRILEDASAALERSAVTISPQAPTNRWRAIIKSPWTRITSTAAAVIILAVVTTTLMSNSPVQAYTLEQTVEANRTLRFVHVRINPPGSTLAEAWAQFAEDGSLVRMRMDFPNSEDGHKITVWEAGKAEVWFKTKNSVLVVREPDLLAKMRRGAEIFDPQARVTSLLRDRDAGKLEAKIVSTPDGEMIKLITPVQNDQQEICYVGPATKLLLAVERYRIVDGQPTLVNRMEYLDYDRQLDDGVFTLNPPADAVRIDQTTQVIGLPKGDLTDQQIAQQVAREFFEAWLAKDYAKVGRLYEGMPASAIEATLGRITILRIIEIGQAEPHPIPATRGLVVPCKVEIEVEGQRSEKEFRPGVRPVYNQPDRWDVFGGID